MQRTTWGRPSWRGKPRLIVRLVHRTAYGPEYFLRSGSSAPVKYIRPVKGGIRLRDRVCRRAPKRRIFPGFVSGSACTDAGTVLSDQCAASVGRYLPVALFRSALPDSRVLDHAPEVRIVKSLVNLTSFGVRCGLEPDGFCGQSTEFQGAARRQIGARRSSVSLRLAQSIWAC